ncbi:MAG TPA: hypothetical protein EYP85_06075 [Armatimonadetes bacterium]|nr:hypothetical protein [Armatimonadota bacterium]
MGQWLTAHQRQALLGVVLVYLALSGAFWQAAGFGFGPDEEPHLLYVQTLVATRHLPVFRADPADPNFEAHQPPLYYLLSIPLYLAARSGGTEVAGRTVALLSMICGALLVVVTAALVGELFPSQPLLALGTAAFVAALPMYQFLTSRVNNDNLSFLLWGVALWLSGRTLRCGWSAPRSLATGATVGAALLTKANGVFLLPLVWVAIGLRASQEERPVRDFLRHAGLVTGVALLLGGWWFVRNLALYGDPLAQRVFNQRFLPTRVKPEDFLHAPPPLRLTPAGYWRKVCRNIFCSFWGLYGHMNQPMAEWVYVLFGLWTAAAGAGLWLLWQEARVGRSGFDLVQRQGLWVLGLGLFGLFALLLRFNTVYYQAQARYLFPLLPGGALFFLLGLQRLAPARGWRYVLGGLLLTQLLASVLSLAVYLHLRPRYL